MRDEDHPRPLEPGFVGRTFDDFLLRPRMSIVGSRRDVSLRCRLSRQIDLELPVVAANMDSVTGTEMARTMALEGGIGFVHRAMPIAEQAGSVQRVKRSHGHVVDEPLCLPRDATIGEARDFIERHAVSGILIEGRRGSRVLAGLLANRDLPLGDGHDDRPVSDFMTPFDRLVVGAPGIGADQAEARMFERRVEKLPLVDAERRIAGLITRKDLLLYRTRPGSSKDDRGRLRLGAAIGARGDFLERAAALVEAGVDALLVDIAHGHSRVMAAAVEALRARFADVPLVCGNVGTADGAAFLRDLGADAIKVGIGPGRGCRTRLETGAGVPQLQAVREAWCAVGEAVPIIADGGIRHDKDIFLALACGASTVMLGSVLSGTEESPGRVIEDPGSREKRKIYRGMTSPQATFRALYDEDPEAIDDALETPPEGQEIQIPYRGSVVPILRRIRGHVASAISYAGEASLGAVRQRMVPAPLEHLVRLSEAAQRESFDR